MKKGKSPINIIVALTQHPALGYLLMPYVAEDQPNGTIQLTEYGGRLPAPMVAKLGETEQKILSIASTYTEKYLMKTFTKAPALPVFYRRLEDPELAKTVRAFVEKKLIEMLELIRAENIPLYQNEKGNKILYGHNMIKVSPYYTDVHFDFATDNTHFHYSLQCKRNGEEVSLLEKKPVIVLTASPATIILHNELHMFHDISSMRILPFTNKAKVSVSASETDKYLEKIVLPVLQYHDITSSSLRIFEEERVCKPVLAVEENIYETTVLKLSYQYEDETFYPGSPQQKKSARMDQDENGKVSIRYYYRDLLQEQKLLQQLETAHLTLVDDSHFRLSEDAPEKDMVDWISNHREMLANEFHLKSGDNKANYCLDEVRMEQELTQNQDWFELHMTVVVGTFRIPFIRFRKNILAGKREYILPDGQIIFLPQEWFSKYTELLEHSEEEKVEEEGKIRIKQMYVGIVESALHDNGVKKK